MIVVESLRYNVKLIYLRCSTSEYTSDIFANPNSFVNNLAIVGVRSASRLGAICIFQMPSGSSDYEFGASRGYNKFADRTTFNITNLPLF